EKLTVNFERKSNQDSLKFSNLNKFELLKIDSLIIQNIHKSKSKSLDVNLPINDYFDSVGLVLNLNEKDLYLNGINIQTSSGKEIKNSEPKFYNGKVKGVE